MRFHRLERDALFVSMDATCPRATWMLPKGTAVSVLPNAASPVTGAETELHVNAPDPISRIWRGWIAAGTKMTPLADGASQRWIAKQKFKRITWTVERRVKRKKVDKKVGGRLPYWAGPNGRELERTGWDQLRERIIATPPRNGVDKRGQPRGPWTLLVWCCRFGQQHVGLLRDALRTIIRRRPRSTNADELTQKLAKLMLDRDVTATEIREERRRLQREEAERAAQIAAREKLRAVKRQTRGERMSTKNEKAPRRSMARTIGETLLSLKAPTTHKIAKRMVTSPNGIARKELIALRDAINAAATRARESKKDGLASKLSSANRLVRRLERAARK